MDIFGNIKKDECDERKDICYADGSFLFDATWRIGIFGLCSLGFD